MNTGAVLIGETLPRRGLSAPVMMENSKMTGTVNEIIQVC